MQKSPWSIAIAAAALLALPITAAAQSTQNAHPMNPPGAQSQQPPSQQPPATAQQQPTTAPQQPTTTPQQPTTAPPPATTSAVPQGGTGQVDAEAAKTHLSAARDTLSQLTSMPEAAKLQGTARTQVSQLIANFNALITTQSDWRSAYAKVDGDVNALLGPDAGDQSVGTSGSTAATGSATGTSGTTGAVAPAGNSQLDPAIRAKLVEFRSHLKEFEKAAGGSTPNAAAGSTAATTSAATGATPPSLSTSSTSNPANPTSAASPDNPSHTGNPPSAASTATPANPASTESSSVSPSSPTASMSASDRERAAGEVNAASNADAQKELDAISAILSASKSGALTRQETALLRKHVEALRAILGRQ